MDIVLDDELLKEYYQFKHNGTYDNETIQSLFCYYKAHITNIAQLKRIGIRDSTLLAQLAQTNLTHQTLLGLCDKTTYKVILHKDKSDYPYVKVSGDILENNFTSTFYKTHSRLKATEHIKALLKGANNIFIYDDYLTKQWDTSKKFFDLLPKKSLTIFYKKYQLNQSHISEIRSIGGVNGNSQPNWSVKLDNKNKQYQDLHDRYLIIDEKIEIILTSGFDYLFDLNKDFTYIVRTK